MFYRLPKTVCLSWLFLSFWCVDVLAHGSIVSEDDLCIIEIGFLKAHFTVYQPQTSGTKEYCEDLPDTGVTVFVLDYLHDSLKDMSVDFRIIKDVTNQGRYAKWEDIVKLEEIDRATVFYHPPVKRPDAEFKVDFSFAEPGDYIGIVTTKHPTKDKTYNAVFPFKVGNTGLGYLWLIIGLILLLQLGYWISNGSLSRWRVKQAGG